MQRWVSVAPFVPALLMTVTQTERAVTIAAAVIWISSYLATRALMGQTGLFTRRHVVVSVIAGSLALVLFFAAAIARVGATNLSVLADVTPKVQGGLFGHATAFSRWFESGSIGVEPPSRG